MVGGFESFPHIFIPASVDGREWYKEATHFLGTAGIYAGAIHGIHSLTSESPAVTGKSIPSNPPIGGGGIIFDDIHKVTPVR